MEDETRADAPFETDVTRILRERAIPFRLSIHNQPAMTVQEAAVQRNMRTGQMVKTMVLRLPDGSYIAALVPGDHDVDLKLIKRLYGVRRLSWVAREEVEALTGYPPGAVSPVGIKGVFEIVADPLFEREEELAISSGRHGAGVRLAAADLLRVIDARMVSIAKPSIEREGDADPGEEATGAPS